MSRYTRFPNGKTSDEGARGKPANRYTRTGDQAARAPDAPASTEGNLQPETPERPSPRADTGSKVIVTLFLVTLMVPIQFFLGSLQLTANRILLLTLFLPMFFKWLSGQSGKLYGTDFIFMLYVLWMGVTLFIAHGTSVIDTVGITTVESLGAFLIGRVYVRTPDDFDRVMKVLYFVMLALVPAAALEATTGIRIYSIIADAIGKTHNWVHSNGGSEQRLGMYRAHTVFEHPILFGTFSASIFGLLYFSYSPKRDGIAGYRRSLLSVAGTFFSLSSGAIISLVAQMGMAFWDFALRGMQHHWKLLIVLVISAFVVVDMLSNRTPFQVFITYAAFSSHNGYVRIAIFNHGMEIVWANPIFGIGQADWERPGWLHSASVDNFWLLMAMRHGFPGFLLIAGSFLTTILRLGGLKISGVRVKAMRHGMVFALIGLSLSLMTVHVWGVTFVFICFLLGTGIWMRDYALVEPEVGSTQKTDADPEPKSLRGRPALRKQ